MSPAELAAELDDVRLHMVTATDKLHGLLISIPVSLVRGRLARGEHLGRLTDIKLEMERIRIDLEMEAEELRQVDELQKKAGR